MKYVIGEGTIVLYSMLQKKYPSKLLDICNRLELCYSNKNDKKK